MADWRKCGLIAAFVASSVAGFVETAPAQETVALPEGKLAIHYYRPDGQYDAWGLHLWESTEKVEGDKIGSRWAVIGRSTRSVGCLR